MSSAMKEPFAVTRLGNGLPRRIIHLPAGECLTRVRLLDESYHCITAVLYNLKCTLVPVRDTASVTPSM